MRAAVAAEADRHGRSYTWCDEPDIPANGMNAEPDLPAAVAAIHHDGRTDIDAALGDFAAAQRRAGRRVRGLLMSYRGDGTSCQSAMVLTDIHTGDQYLVSQPLGSGSNACSADPQGFARASRVLRDALGQQPDLVICNRFGSLEAGNGGFTAELLELLTHGIPVLVAVSTRHLAAWQRFIGEAPLLDADPAAWSAWFEGVFGRRVTQGPAPRDATLAGSR